MIDFLASSSKLAAHLRPVWDALGPGERGSWFKQPDALIRHRSNSPPVTVVASYDDLKPARQQGRSVVLMEHGSGQSYVGEDNGAYIGAPDREGVVGVLAPGQVQLARHTAAHPHIQGEAVGCPKMDRWYKAPATPESGLVALTWHWDRLALPETRSAWKHYVGALRSLTRRFPLIGHHHPYWGGEIRNVYEKLGIEYVPTLDEVFERAAVLVADNTSALYEFASLDRPVVVLNAPWYRRDVHHGGRFWEWADVGLQCDEPADLADTIDIALLDAPSVAERRREVVTQVYAVTDGTASERAVAALRRFVAWQ